MSDRTTDIRWPEVDRRTSTRREADRTRITNPQIRSRIYNWKFTQALALLSSDHGDSTVEDRALVQALSNTFGDCGWFDNGSAGMATIIVAAVDRLLNNGRSSL